MDQSQLNWIANFIWGIADDVLRNPNVRGKYGDATPARIMPSQSSFSVASPEAPALAAEGR